MSLDSFYKSSTFLRHTPVASTEGVINDSGPPIAEVLNLWVATPLGVKQPFHRAYTSDIYITIHDSRKKSQL